MRVLGIFIMSLLKFLLLSLKPLSKAPDIWDYKDFANAVILLGGGSVMAFQDWFKPYHLFLIPAILFLIAGFKLQFKLAKLESQPTPNIKYVNHEVIEHPISNTYYPASTTLIGSSLPTPIEHIEKAFFLRLLFDNKVSSPKVDISTVLGASAIITLFKVDGSQVASWNARNAETDFPVSYGDIVNKNTWKWPANKNVPLDLGFRVRGQKDFNIQMNVRPDYQQYPANNPIIPGGYYVNVKFRGDNLDLNSEKNNVWLGLHIPEEVQSDDKNEITIKEVKKPSWVI